MKMRLIHGLIKDARLRRPGAGLCKRTARGPAARLIEDGCDKGVHALGPRGVPELGYMLS